MSILRVRDDKGNVQEILALRGEPGKDYVLTQEDKQEIADMIDGVEMNLNATPETIVDVISNAPEGATVTLADGNYDMLTLTCEAQDGKIFITGHPAATKFPANLTITGTKKAIVAGISLTSGYKNNFSNFNVDTSFNTLPEGLSIKNITITDSISLRNANLDKISIVECDIGKGVYIAPNRFVDNYGLDGVTSHATNRYSLQRCYCKNILIKNNNIPAPNTYSNNGIYIQGCEDIIIRNNKITGGKQGIMIKSLDTKTPILGEIRIGENTITGSSSNFIYVEGLKDANLHIVKNTLSECGSTARRFIYVKGYTNSFVCFYRREADGQNTYDGEKLTTATNGGIIVEGNVSYTTSTEFKEHTDSFNNHKSNTNNPHKVTAKQIGIEDVNNLVVKNITYQATPNTLATIIANAQANSTIQLAAGTYSLLSLVGNKSYPENLTIIGAENNSSIIDGISITSGIRMQDIYKQDSTGYRISDITSAIMPKGLRIEKIYFTKSFCIRNCDISDLVVKNCTFGPGANISLVPNSSNDDLGDDGSGRLGTVRNFATRYAHNTTISHCTFMDCYPPEGSSLPYCKNAIYAKTVDGLTISNCDIHKAVFNGIQITGTSGTAYNAKSKGRIIITNNFIENTLSRSIRLSTMEDAYVCVEMNKLYNANTGEDELTNTEVIKASSLDASVQTRWDLNFYNDAAISVGNNITEEKDLSNAEKHIENKENPHNVTAEQIGAITQKELDEALANSSGSANAVLYTKQTLTPEQQEQARENIGTISEELFDGLLKPVYTELRYSVTTNKCINATTGALVNAGKYTHCVAKASVKPNQTYIVSGSASHTYAHYAFYAEDGSYIENSASTPSYATSNIENVELIAPENARYINVAYVEGYTVAKIEELSMGLVPKIDAVLYTPQSLTDAQKEQARTNIGSVALNTIVDQSLEEEWDSGFVLNGNCPCQFYGWDWKKYIDGTFTLVGWLREATIYAEDESWVPLSWINAGEEGAQETDLPFDAYEMEVTYWWEEITPNSNFAEITGNISDLYFPSWLYIEAFASAETRERMKTEGMEDMTGNIYVSITGKWRVDE